MVVFGEIEEIGDAVREEMVGNENPTEMFEAEEVESETGILGVGGMIW